MTKLNEQNVVADQLESLRMQIRSIELRNQSVETDKAWETSWSRIVTITVMTYVIASLVLLLIGVKDFWLAALIPTIGYFLSTLSLPMMKRWWIGRHSVTRHSVENQHE